MPIHGRVNGDTQRIAIPVSVSNGRQPYRAVEFEIDTASDVELAMSPQDIAELGLDQSIDTDYRRNGASGNRQPTMPKWNGMMARCP